MASKIKVDQLEGSTGSTITVPTGQTLTITDGLAASTITSGTLADARLPTVPVTKGGTGLTSLGSAGEVVKVNSGGNALEFGTAPSGKILQVKQQVVHDTHSISSNAPTFADITNLTIDITPASTSNKILVTAHINVSSSNGYRTFHRFTRNNSALGVGLTNVGSRVPATMTTAGVGNQGAIASMMFLDAPNSSSSQTYAVESCTEGTSGSIRINGELSDTNNNTQGRTISTITVMEIEG